MAYLMITSGRGTGRAMRLDGDASIGRAPDNTMMLDDTIASRYHAMLRQLDDGSWAVEDLDSLNGTLLNDAPIRKQRLKNEDVLLIGETELLFYENELPPDMQLPFAEMHPSQELVVPNIIKMMDQQLGQSVDQASIDEFYLTLGISGDSGPSSRDRLDELKKHARQFSGLFDVAKAMQAAGPVEEMAANVLRRVITLFRGSRGVLFRIGTETEPLVIIPEDAEQDSFSQPEIDWVAQTRSAILSTRPQPLDEKDRPEGNRSPTVLAAPVLLQGQVSGVLYLESDVEASAYEERDLELLSVIAGLVAQALENRSRAASRGFVDAKTSQRQTSPGDLAHYADAGLEPAELVHRLATEVSRLIDPEAVNELQQRLSGQDRATREYLEVVRQDFDLLKCLIREIDCFLMKKALAPPKASNSFGILLADFVASFQYRSGSEQELTVNILDAVDFPFDTTRMRYVLMTLTHFLSLAAESGPVELQLSQPRKGMAVVSFNVKGDALDHDRFMTLAERSGGYLLAEQVVMNHGGKILMFGPRKGGPAIEIHLPVPVSGPESRRR